MDSPALKEILARKVYLVSMVSKETRVLMDQLVPQDLPDPPALRAEMASKETLASLES